MKTASIFSTETVDTVAEYVALYRDTDNTLDWDLLGVRDWNGLANLLEIELDNPKRKARRSINKAAEDIAGSKRTPISTKLRSENVTPETVEKVLSQPVPEKKEVKVIPIDPTVEERAEIAKKEITEQYGTPNDQEAKRKELIEKAKRNLGVKEKKEEAVPVATSELSEEEQLLSLLKKMAGKNSNTQVNREEVESIVSEQLGELQSSFMNALDSSMSQIMGLIENNTKTVSVSVNEMPAVNVGLTHFKFEDILLASTARLHSYLVGAAGSGKTHTCEQVAQALGLSFGCISFCAQSSKTDLLGYMSVSTGEYFATEFRKAFEFGGVFVADEIDNGNPNIISVLNSALSNGVCAFPDGMVKKHADFVLIACANTYGNGADRMYVGRNQLDAATLDRFVIIDFPYDEVLEMEIAPNKQFAKIVQAVREELRGERVVISPRATIKGGKLLNAGMDQEKVMNLVLFSLITPEMKDRAMKAVIKIK